jgi:hypothetical protein
MRTVHGAKLPEGHLGGATRQEGQKSKQKLGCKRERTGRKMRSWTKVWAAIQAPHGRMRSEELVTTAAPLTLILCAFCAARELAEQSPSSNLARGLPCPPASTGTRHCFTALPDLPNEVQHDKDRLCPLGSDRAAQKRAALSLRQRHICGWRTSEHILPVSRLMSQRQEEPAACPDAGP